MQPAKPRTAIHDALDRVRARRAGPESPAPAPMPPLKVAPDAAAPAPLVPAPAAGGPPEPKKRKDRPPAQPHPESVRRRCGHYCALGDIRNSDCPHCTAEKRRAKAAAKAAKLAAPAPADKGRLPDGARFENFVYAAATTTWTGELWIPVRDAAGAITGYQKFAGSAQAVSRLHHELDDQYRATLKTPEAPAAEVGS